MFIHDAILESVTCGDTQIAATNLKDSITKMKKHDSKNKPHGFKYQFKVCLLHHTCTQVCGMGSSHSFILLQILEQVSPNPKEVHCGGALSYPERNRSQEFLPGKSTQCHTNLPLAMSFIFISQYVADKWRVSLRKEKKDYINAVNVNVNLFKHALITWLNVDKRF